MDVRIEERDSFPDRKIRNPGAFFRCIPGLGI